jgi:hypothetical protein
MKGETGVRLHAYQLCEKPRIIMNPNEDFRFQSHLLLVELDAATTKLMMLVVAGELSGNRWDEALALQCSAYEAWMTAVAGIRIDPMPVLDARPPDDPLTS